MRLRFGFQSFTCFVPHGLCSIGEAPASPGGLSGGSVALAGESSGGSGPSEGSPTSQTAPAAPSGGSDSQYDFMNEVFGGPPSTPPAPSAAPTPAQAAPAATPAQAPAPAAAPQQPAQPAPAQPAQAPDPAQAQPGQVQQQPAPSAQFDPADPVSLARGLVENYDAAVNHLATNVFAMTPQELDALEANVGGEVPRLLAKAVVYMQTQMLTQMGRIIPQMMQRQTEVTSRHSQNVNSFYQAWPSIDRTKHDAHVRQIASTFRQLNPDVPTDKMIETIGPYILMQLGLPLVPMAKPGAPTARPAAVRQNGSQPFQPAAPGAVTVHQEPVADPFGYMGAQEGG